MTMIIIIIMLSVGLPMADDAYKRTIHRVRTTSPEGTYRNSAGKCWMAYVMDTCVDRNDALDCDNYFYDRRTALFDPQNEASRKRQLLSIYLHSSLASWGYCDKTVLQLHN